MSEDSQTELGTGEGGDQEGTHAASAEFVPPSDGSWVPRSRLDSVLQDVGRLNAQLAVSEASAPRAVAAALPTHEEIRSQLDNGDITEAQADDIRERRVLQNVQQQVSVSTVDSVRTQRLNDELAAYVREVPDVSQQGSDSFNHVQTAYRQMVDEDGLPDTSGTQVAAMRQVLGPLTAMQAKKKAEPYTEEGGGDGGGGDQAPKTLFDGLDSGRRSFYEEGIRQGRYENRDAVEKELKGYVGRGNTL